MQGERLANRLKVLRAEKDLTQQALAELIGTTRKSINAIEMERMVPSTLLALKLARALDTSVEKLFHLAEPHHKREHRQVAR
ncbi:XRE family transcriptional regulator [Rhodanobacter thiooxydans]|uniref:XRE family transcriptional regulator n=1 Tax=Rhodanobacter thiooxydans TaxID=416169 RepID=A0A154QH89_9GAMM|nr:helix-turn-helix domain-containing protein [Rhodanobacter thiooxydans]EIL99928.1 XRE family transcriptional regulator [Rhodanobacter thiooxydans LCS2]KZC23565.1 XRE family transcriptional regulator [Rhodanobacter thiooxydans]MCW0203640.1 helix-turn-helix domain-containing protein [Rhodanobacter thiooxydans]